ncbi:MAG: guanylate kinase [Oscillatoriales cyanobacterium RU_3_3]|nr:guanylate kinase [Microcoleus sp. SU_5_6]NJL69014.1 guanylate kinase [Microcoleus sp. SM1_3_4]NJM60986.1 guanylate kinase [Oscillatoriales cyanobacterium RU_3_3]NJR25872.1 guanylate kinase [Richelia sp. CSU_2_1]
MKTGKLIVLTGPSGVGKGTLVKSILKRHRELYLSVSVTTRLPREGEIEGQHYYFVSRSRFEEMVEAGELAEWAEFAGNFYGTPYFSIQQGISEGKWVILEIELEGARQIRNKFPEALRVFILPPSWEELERRLRSRGQDSESAISRRLLRAKEEIEAAAEFDFQVINDDLEVALQRLESLLFATVES